MTDITWYKRFHGTWKDPKFKAAAIIAGTTRCEALSVWDAILDESSESDHRGTILNVNRRVIAAGLDLAANLVDRIWDAFVELRMITGERIAAWAKRQGAAVEKLAKVVTAGAERVRRHRRNKADAARQGALQFAESTAALHDQESVTSAVTPAADLESDSDINSEANASESARACAEVVQIANHRKEIKVVRGHRKSRIPADWQPDDQDRQFAFGKGYDDIWIAEQAAACVDYSLAHGKSYFDFHAYWRNWVNNAPRFGNAARSPAGRRSEPPSLIAAACAALAFGDVDPFEH